MESIVTKLKPEAAAKEQDKKTEPKSFNTHTDKMYGRMRSVVLVGNRWFQLTLVPRIQGCREAWRPPWRRTGCRAVPGEGTGSKFSQSSPLKRSGPRAPRFLTPQQRKGCRLRCSRCAPCSVGMAGPSPCCPPPRDDHHHHCPEAKAGSPPPFSPASSGRHGMVHTVWTGR